MISILNDLHLFLKVTVANAIWQRWGMPHIDLFATRDNGKIPTFVSTFPDEKAWTTDTCYTMVGNVGICPPTPLIPNVLFKQDNGGGVVLVAW